MMINGETNQQFLRNLNLQIVEIPISDPIWKIGQEQLDQLLLKLGKPDKTEHPRIAGGNLYTWHFHKLSVWLIPEEWGVAFSHLDLAKRLIPKVRQQGLRKETMFWYVVLDKVEIQQLLSLEDLKEFPSSIPDTAKVYQIPNTKGFLRLLGPTTGHWYETLEDLNRYEAFLLEMEAMI